MDCEAEYRERGLLASNAMYQCKSPVYPGMDTWSVRCNNIVECHGGEDEKYCQEELVNIKLVSSDWLKVLAPLIGQYHYR